MGHHSPTASIPLTSRRGRLPGWLATAAEADADVTIDETTIAAALAALRIPQVSDHFKRGLQLQYLTTARKDGRGTHAVIRLPAGVTAEKIARRRADLATGRPTSGHPLFVPACLWASNDHGPKRDTLP